MRAAAGAGSKILTRLKTQNRRSALCHVSNVALSDGQLWTLARHSWLCRAGILQVTATGRARCSECQNTSRMDYALQLNSVDSSEPAQCGPSLADSSAIPACRHPLHGTRSLPFPQPAQSLERLARKAPAYVHPAVASHSSSSWRLKKTSHESVSDRKCNTTCLSELMSQPYPRFTLALGVSLAGFFSVLDIAGDGCQAKGGSDSSTSPGTRLRAANKA